MQINCKKYPPWVNRRCQNFLSLLSNIKPQLQAIEMVMPWVCAGVTRRSRAAKIKAMPFDTASF